MYTKKPPKSELPDKGPFTYHKISSHDNVTRNWTQGFYRVVSIDPGEKNLAIRIERRSVDAKIIVTEFFDKYDLHSYSTINNTSSGTNIRGGKGVKNDGRNGSVSEIYDIVIKILDKYIQYFLESHMILIERQMTINYRMVRLSQCIITYFLMKLEKAIYYPMIFEISNKLKSDMLNAPKGLNPKEMKQWAIELALLILECRGDTKSIEHIKTAPKRKQDDLSDVVIQIEAFFYYYGYKTTFETMNVVTEKTKFSLSANIPSSNSISSTTSYPTSFNSISTNTNSLNIFSTTTSNQFTNQNHTLNNIDFSNLQLNNGNSQMTPIDIPDLTQIFSSHNNMK